MALRHRKRRNAAFIHEVLVRRIGEAMLDGVPVAATKALGIITEHFAAGTPLAGELQIAEVIRSTRGASQALARRVIAEAMTYARSADPKRLDAARDSLIADVDRAFGKDITSRYKIGEYRLLGAIQILMDSARSGRTLVEGVERVKLEEALISFMTSSADVEQVGEVHDPLTYKMALKRFDERYGAELSVKQKRLMEAYVAFLFSGNRAAVRSVIAEDVRAIGSSIRAALAEPKLISDAVLRERLNTARLRLHEEVARLPVGEELVSEMMLYHDLLSEIERHDR